MIFVSSENTKEVVGTGTGIRAGAGAVLAMLLVKKQSDG